MRLTVARSFVQLRDGVRHRWIINDRAEAGFPHSICEAAWYPKKNPLDQGTAPKDKREIGSALE